MKSTRIGLGITAVAALTWAGCGTAITSDTTLQELLTSSGLGSITVGDVFNAINQFTGNSGLMPFGGNLTQDQQDQLEALQEQFDSGQITLQDYQEKTQSILGVSGDAAGPFFGPGQFGGFPGGFGRGGFGGPPTGMGGPGAQDPLNLTDDQKAKAESIFDAMRTEVLQLQDDAHTKIDGVLTDEQRQQLDNSASAFHGGFRFFGPPMGAGPLSDSLDLSDEQKAQIDSILNELHASIEARRVQANAEFRVILTTEQQATFDQIFADHDPTNAGT